VEGWYKFAAFAGKIEINVKILRSKPVNKLTR
jgi:hypothetical protein